MKNISISIFYIARLKDLNSTLSFKSFAKSYAQHQAGINHNLYIIFKGFDNQKNIDRAKLCFKELSYKSLFFKDEGYDIGTYIEAARMVDSKFICCFKTSTIILSENWLLKFYVNLIIPTVGLVGSTGSFESLHGYDKKFPIFPSVHIRSTAFMIRTKYFLRLTSKLKIKTKDDCFLFESGHSSLTSMIFAEGKDCLVVGKNGRGYAKEFWKKSGTYRFGLQENLLIADNVTDFYMDSTSSYKNALSLSTWG